MIFCRKFWWPIGFTSACGLRRFLSLFADVTLEEDYRECSLRRAHGWNCDNYLVSKCIACLSEGQGMISRNSLQKKAETNLSLRYFRHSDGFFLLTPPPILQCLLCSIYSTWNLKCFRKVTHLPKIPLSGNMLLARTSIRSLSHTLVSELPNRTSTFPEITVGNNYSFATSYFISWQFKGLLRKSMDVSSSWCSIAVFGSRYLTWQQFLHQYLQGDILPQLDRSTLFCSKSPWLSGHISKMTFLCIRHLNCVIRSEFSITLCQTKAIGQNVFVSGTELSCFDLAVASMGSNLRSWWSLPCNWSWLISNHTELISIQILWYYYNEEVLWS